MVAHRGGQLAGRRAAIAGRLVGSGLRRAPAGGSTVGELGAAEPLRRLPALAFPAEIIVERTASRSALVAFEANRYSVPPAHAGRRVVLRARVGEPHLRLFSPAGSLLATHRHTAAGAGQTIRNSEHAAALEQAVLDAFTTQPACRKKVNRPPGDRALIALAALHGHAPPATPIVSLERYAELAQAAGR